MLQCVVVVVGFIVGGVVSGKDADGADPFGPPMQSTNNVYGCQPATSGDGIVYVFIM